MTGLKRYQKKFRLATIAILLLSLFLMVVGPEKLVGAAQQIYNKWMVLTMILDKIERFYVEEKDPDELLKNAIDGMLSGLDPHSLYIPAEAYKDYEKKFQGYVGVGLKYNIIGKQYVVTSLVENGPAVLAGVRVGDRIQTLEGRPVAQLSNTQIDELLSNATEAAVTLEVSRPGHNEPFTFSLPARQIKVESIPVAFKLNETTGYIRIDHFKNSTPMELDFVFAELKGNGMKQLLLDLRNNCGGAFDAGVAVADRFIPAGKMIVFTQGRMPHSSEEFIATASATLPYLPLVVLVNEATASDAEIVAGAIQDWDRGIIIGKRTFGKAMVQTEYPFQDGSVLLLTTARYYTPMGRLIQRDYTKLPGQEDTKTFKTPKGRTVYGGGGIVPDFELQDPVQTTTPFMKTLYLAPQNPLFSFADAYVTESEPQMEMLDFLHTFQVSDVLLEKFSAHMTNLGLQVSASEFENNKSNLKSAIKTHIAWRMWGEEGRYTALAKQDKQIQQALDYFQHANKLASR